MAKIAIFIDHDIMMRHFVLNGALAALSNEHDVLFVFPENHKRVKTNLGTLPVKRYRTLHVSNRRMYLYRRLYHATLLKNFRGGADHRVLTRLWWHILGWKAFIMSWVCSLPVTHRFYRWWMLRKIGENDALNHLLAEERPDVIIHPTVLEGLFVSDLVHWGKRNSTPTVFIMNSWDNPSTRVMLVGHPDRLLVWGEQTRKGAIQHLRMPPERIVCLGAAQFDLYRCPPKIQPAEYRRKLGVPDGAKVLLYAGSSKGLNESRHLLMLEQAIEEGVLKDCFVVYRPHPWRAYPEGEVDFFSLTWRHVALDPSMEACYRLSRVGQRIHVELANYEDTHVTLTAVDAVISPLSTILLEAALHGKPVAVYLPDEDMTGNKFMYAVAQMSFFRDFFQRVDCIRCESPSRFAEDCRELLRMTEEPGISTRLKDQCNYFVEPSDHPYAERLGEVIGALLGSTGREVCLEAECGTFDNHA
jgi:hypothetical protein